MVALKTATTPANSRYSLFVLEASLTDAGLARWRDVVAAVYRYLAEALAAPAAWVFDEIKAT